jgi:methyl-accepting chemotaxis protein
MTGNFAIWQSIGLAGALFLLTALAVANWKLRGRNRRLRNALDNMSTGLCMFDSAARIVVCDDSRGGIEMYKLSPEVVKPGCTLRELLQHRKACGLLTGDVEKYYRDILESVAGGKVSTWRVETGDGRYIHAVNLPIADGGWVTTHEDITEQHAVEKQNEEMLVHQNRRLVIDTAILEFRERMDGLLQTVRDSAD